VRRVRGVWVLVVAALLAACSGDRGAAKPAPASAAPAASPVASPAGARSSDPGAPPEIDRTTPLPNPLPEVAGRVNGHPISLRLVRLLAEQMAPPGKPPGPPEPFAYRQALQQAIIREILFEEAVARKIQADDASIEQAYNEARLNFKDDKAWTALLAGQGMDPQSYRAELRMNHTIQKMLSQVADQAPAQVTDQEAQAFYDTHPALFDTGERVRASHILVRVPPSATPAQKEQLRKKAEGLLAKVRAGQDFAALARQSSEDPGSAAKGGDLGAFGRGMMVPPFDQAAFSLKPGEVSPLVETQFGFHVIKLTEKQAARKMSFPEIKDRLKMDMSQQKRQQAQQSFLNGLRAKAKIETFL